MRCHGDQCHIFLRALPDVSLHPVSRASFRETPSSAGACPKGWAVLAAPRGDAP